MSLRHCECHWCERCSGSGGCNYQGECIRLFRGSDPAWFCCDCAFSATESEVWQYESTDTDAEIDQLFAQSRALNDRIDFLFAVLNQNYQS
jgi:hypothetical protein